MKNFGERLHLEPNLFCASVMFSLVWESKEGFTMRQLIKIHMWFRIYRGCIGQVKDQL